MKTIRTSLFAGVAILLAMSSAQAVEVAIDGGFEIIGAGPFVQNDGEATGWVTFPSSGTVVTTNTPADVFSGAWSAQITNADDSGANPVLKNQFAGAGVAFAGAPVTVSFWAKGSTANGGVIFPELFSEGAGGVTKSEILGGGPLAVTGDYQQFIFDTTLGPDVSKGVTLQFGAITGAVPGSFAELFVDDVSINVVPVPAAVWLFGSALGLLGWIRRKAS